MYRIKITMKELIFLRLNLHRIEVNDEELVLVNELYDKLVNAKPHSVSITKKRATKKATEVRIEKAKEKIQNAINLLHLENKTITHYSIATTSGVSYNTVKKYIPDIDKIWKL